MFCFYSLFSFVVLFDIAKVGIKLMCSKLFLKKALKCIGQIPLMSDKLRNTLFICPMNPFFPHG